MVKVLVIAQIAPNEQVLPMVGNFIFVRLELLPGFLIKLNIKNQSRVLFVKPRTTAQQNYRC
jgi:hypothetical protein